MGEAFLKNSSFHGFLGVEYYSKKMKFRNCIHYIHYMIKHWFTDSYLVHASIFLCMQCRMITLFLKRQVFSLRKESALENSPMPWD